MEKTYPVSESVLNAILNYMAARPYAEVAQIIQALSSVIQAEKPVEEAPKKK